MSRVLSVLGLAWLSRPFGWALAVLIVQPASLAQATTVVEGLARVVDGDTVTIDGRKIRLEGFDAPETDQLCLSASRKSWPCGVEARDHLQEHTAGKVWRCVLNAQDKYGRDLGVCSVEGQDIGQWMVRQGWAMSFTRYSHRYDADQEFASAGLRGLWAGAFIAPWDWRSRSRQTVVLGALEVPVEAQEVLLSSVSEKDTPIAGCVVKGNLNRHGACIYHLPGGRYYAKTRIDADKGERWFCSAEEAEVAGCRRSSQ